MADNGVAGLDSTDRQILRELQADGRISNVELAERVRLSPSPCLRRVKSLEERGYIRGYIRGYMAVLDREQVDRGMYVHVMVSLTSQRQETLEEFERAVSALPEVLECYLMAGESDYLLAVAVADLEAYQRFFRERLGEVPGVASLRSLISMKTVKYTTALPV
ncbi:Lrp/AsnC family transcriptional regulator [Kineosporia sp. A_224]|uniref:Lrp/AsnC family transcriptional regulator n=1 Tax=Kineosporia sp. A_224 TaxID=1962180 RepID=UPI000B4BD82D|nr:Lrp/AsnC family transcriptional regulator [Kineosporia sp. A_224]